MALNNFDDDQFNPDLGFGGESEPEPSQPENQPSSGKNFLLAIGIIGVILILALVLLLLIAPNIIAQQRANNAEQVAQINAANTATAMAATANAQVVATTAAPIILAQGQAKTPVILVATSTPVVAGAQLSANELATVQALQTQVALGGDGTTNPQATSTALPKTGFADEYGIPGVLGLAVILIAVIFLSRKLRTSAQ
jgi:LPXTG-motif cell wall-anchored protein